MSLDSLILRCTNSLFKRRFVSVNLTVIPTQPTGEILGSGTPQQIPQITVSIENSDLDPSHAQVVFQHQEFYLRDLNSSSGTWLKVLPESPTVLQLGDFFMIGNQTFQVLPGPIQKLQQQWHQIYELDFLDHDYSAMQVAAAAQSLAEIDPPFNKKDYLQQVIDFLKSSPDQLQSIIFHSDLQQVTIGYTPLKQPFLEGKIQIYYRNGFFLEIKEENELKVFKKVKQEVKLVPGMAFAIGSLEFEALRFCQGSHSQIGHRPTNQDAEISIPNLFLNQSTSSYYAIFDGHGGDQCSKFLKSNLHKIVKKHLRSPLEQADQELKNAFAECDETYYLREPDIGKQVGSAAIVAFIQSNILTTCNVGDSRILLSQAGRAIQLTRDHKPDQADQKQRILDNGGLVIFGRVLGKLAISRAFGDFEFKDIASSDLYDEVKGPLLISEPEIAHRALDPDDEFLLLACDGLFEVFSNQEAVDFVRERLAAMGGSQLDLEGVLRELINEAIYGRGSGDNVSCILVVIKKSISQQ